MNRIWIKTVAAESIRRMELRMLFAICEGQDIEPDKTNFKALSEKKWLQGLVTEKLSPNDRVMEWGWTQHYTHQIEDFYCYRSQHGNQFLIYEIIIEHISGRMAYFYIELMDDAVAVQLKLMGLGT